MEALIDRDTAGSPVDENIRWTNRPVADLAEELQGQGFPIGVDALRRILFKEMGLSRRQAFKDEAIAQLRAKYEQHHLPVLSIDTKKKEIRGNVHYPGSGHHRRLGVCRTMTSSPPKSAWCPMARTTPFATKGFLYLARGADTSQLACDAIWRCWQRMGRRDYGGAPRLLLLCNCRNGRRQHRFKKELCYLTRDMRCNIQLAHYPPGCSKYNPIEHRLFCHVSRALQAVVLKTIPASQGFHRPHQDGRRPAGRGRKFG